MAHANNSIITGKFKGSLGKQLVFRDWQGKTVVAKSPRQELVIPLLPGSHPGKIPGGYALWKVYPHSGRCIYSS